MRGTFRVFNETSYRVPRTRMRRLFDEQLAKHMSLNVILTDPKRAAELNKTYRDADYTPNVLTFPTDDPKRPAEIYLTPELVAEDVEVTLAKDLFFLYVHGCLHLLGHTHGEKMEHLEDQWYNTYC